MEKTESKANSNRTIQGKAKIMSESQEGQANTILQANEINAGYDSELWKPIKEMIVKHFDLKHFDLTFRTKLGLNEMKEPINDDNTLSGDSLMAIFGTLTFSRDDMSLDDPSSTPSNMTYTNASNASANKVGCTDLALKSVEEEKVVQGKAAR